MSLVSRSSLEGALFWIGGSAFFACEPLLSAYFFGGFSASARVPTLRQAAETSAAFGGAALLLPALLFGYAQSRRTREGYLERRRGAGAIALVLGVLLAGTFEGLARVGDSSPSYLIWGGTVASFFLSRVTWTRGE